MRRRITSANTRPTAIGRASPDSRHFTANNSGSSGWERSDASWRCGPRPWRCIVYAQRHRLPGKIEERYRASYCAVDELLATSDCVSIHLPRSLATHGFIGRRELGIIKPGALLINVSQPQMIDREAVCQALASGRLGGFGLDTFYDEPGSADDPLLKFRN